MEFERMDEFEQELHQALERRPAPPLLKQRILAERNRRMRQPRGWMPHLMWLRVAASLLIIVLVGGTAEWGIHRQEQQRKGEEARRQVMIALRITGRELNQVRTRLTTHDRAQER